MTNKDIALLYHHPLLKAFFYWDTVRYHCAHYICHVQQIRQQELGKQELLDLIDHYMRMTPGDFVEELSHVEPCFWCDTEQLFGSKNRRPHEREAS